MADRDWRVSPGEILADWMDEAGVSERMLAKATGFPREQLSGVIAGEVHITERIAVRLQSVTGITKTLWLALEKAYRE